jgi:quinol monooxygenase YgiN
VCPTQRRFEVSDNVFWIAELAIRPGQLDAFRALMNDMVEATKANEPGALNYEWFISEDSTTCHIYERYADSAAVLTHMGNFAASFGERWAAAVEVTRATAYGTPSDEVKALLAGSGGTLMAPLGGFVR